MNACHFLGRICHDLELKDTQSGKKVINFKIAVERRYKKAGVAAKEVSFLKMEAWDTGAELIKKHFKKGSPIIVHCSVKPDDYETAEGEKRYGLSFRVDSFDFVPRNGGSDENNDGPEAISGESSPPSAPPVPAKTGKGKKKQDDDDGSVPF